MDPFAEALKIAHDADLEYERLIERSTTLTISGHAFPRILSVNDGPLMAVLEIRGTTLIVEPLFARSPVERLWAVMRPLWRYPWESMLWYWSGRRPS